MACQAIIWTNAGILSIGPFETSLSEIFILSRGGGGGGGVNEV